MAPVMYVMCHALEEEKFAGEEVVNSQYFWNYLATYWHLLYRYWWNTRIFAFTKKSSSSHAVKMLFLSSTCEDIGVAMVTNILWYYVSKMNFKKSCLLCRNFISIYQINRTHKAAWGYKFYLLVLKVFLTREKYFQHSKIKFVSSSAARGHVIPSIYICPTLGEKWSALINQVNSRETASSVTFMRKIIKFCIGRFKIEFCTTI